MILGIDTLGTVALGEVANASTPNPVVQAWEALTGRVFLYEMTVFNFALAGSWIYPLGVITLGTPPPLLGVGESILRLSDTGYISTPADSVPDITFDGVVDGGLRLTRSSPASPEVSRRATVGLGNFSLLNPDGSYDATVSGYSVDGRLFRVLLGLNTYRYDQFTVVFQGRMVQWGNNLSSVGVVVRDESYRLEIPMQTDLYGGTGGYDGGADLTGKPRPLSFGQVLNVSPPMINSANLIFQVHHRAISSIDAVYDRGASVTPGADYATYAALVAAAPGAGTYATCLAFGLFKLGTTPSGLITADVKGDASGGYIDTTGGIAKRIIKDFGGMADANLDLYSWSDFTTAMSGTIGWWHGTEAITVAAVLDQIFAHCGAWWGDAFDGLFRVGYLASPTTASYTLALTDADLIDMEILDPLPGTFPPRFRQRVGYQKLWTTQQDTDLAGAVTAARRLYLSQNQRLASSQDTAVRTSYLLAVDPDPLPSLFYNLSDAQALATALLALYKVTRQTVRVTLDLKGLGARLSSTVVLTHPRLNAGVATAMLCMDITLVADSRQIQLVLWG